MCVPVCVYVYVYVYTYIYTYRQRQREIEREREPRYSFWGCACPVATRKYTRSRSLQALHRMKGQQQTSGYNFPESENPKPSLNWRAPPRAQSVSLSLSPSFFLFYISTWLCVHLIHRDTRMYIYIFFLVNCIYLYAEQSEQMQGHKDKYKHIEASSSSTKRKANH